MAIRNSTPIPFVPIGLTDAIDQASAFPGACQVMQNLVFDRTNRGAVIARPGVVADTSFGGFSSPGVVSAMLSVGTLIYGMVGSNATPGYDEPFCYDTVARAFIAVSGVTAANVPATQATTGAWTPPTMDSVGIYIVVTHSGFSGANFFGYFNVTNHAAPTWSAGNTTTNALPSVPLWVAQFYGRAYFGLGNAVYFTDSLALSISNTNFAAVLTIDDKSNTTVAVGLPMSNTTGGVLQSLVVFKQNSIWQITGDIALTGSPLSLNKLSSNIGCSMPRSAQSTPTGIIFISSDGPRVIELNSTVHYLRPPEGATPDVVAPFKKATDPSRVCGAYNNGIYRVGFNASFNVWDSSYTSADYWFDLIFNRWNGIHTFPYHCATSVNGVFYLASNSSPGKLFISEVVPSSTSVYVDNSAAYATQIVSSCMAGAPMTESAIVESTIELSSSALGVSYYMSMYDDQNNPKSIATITLDASNPLWGTAIFGQFKWKSNVVSSHTYTIPWVNPIVAKKMVFSIGAAAASNVSIKEAMFRIQTLGYTNA